jgi:hypothetical protein
LHHHHNAQIVGDAAERIASGRAVKSGLHAGTELLEGASGGTASVVQVITAFLWSAMLSPPCRDLEVQPVRFQECIRFLHL